MSYQEPTAQGLPGGLLIARAAVQAARDRADQASDASGGRTDTNDT